MPSVKDRSKKGRFLLKNKSLYRYSKLLKWREKKSYKKHNINNNLEVKKKSKCYHFYSKKLGKHD